PVLIGLVGALGFLGFFGLGAQLGRVLALSVLLAFLGFRLFGRLGLVVLGRLVSRRSVVRAVRGRMRMNFAGHRWGLPSVSLSHLNVCAVSGLSVGRKVC